MSTPLPSTLLPPHFWATVDKATPSRTTNQAVLIVARDESGTPCPIPVSAPPVYNDFQEASYDRLAKQLLDVTSEHFSEETLSRLCGVAADGPYQTTGFRKYLTETLGLEDNDDLALPITWDTAHLLNLAFTDVRDSKTDSGHFFKPFIKRCNVFNHVLAHGKGFAFLQMVDKDARRPVSYATQRFASSSHEQWLKIEQSFSSLWKAFNLLHPNRSREEEWQYMIAGFDFVADLLALLDIVSPVIDMLRAQALDTPVWKLKLWWPKVKEMLKNAANGDPEAFPRLEKVRPNLHPEGVFKQVSLLHGWFVVEDRGKDSGEDRFTWQEREWHDIKTDHERFANDLMNALDERVSSVIHQKVFSQLEVFDASNLVRLHCGTANDGNISFDLPEGDVEEYGVLECREILKAASQRKHILSAGINFNVRMAHAYMRSLKEAVMKGIWNGLCPEWFEVLSGEEAALSTDDVALLEIHAEESCKLDSYFVMRFSNGTTRSVKVLEQLVFKSFYANKNIFKIAKPPSCALLDIILAKGGPEAIAESFYNAMRNQQQSGGQLNETLVRRTKVQ